MKKDIQKIDLRDLFAAFALARSPHNAYEYDKTAAWCYRQAEAMIEEKERSQEK
jgi:hypothetical protein